MKILILEDTKTKADKIKSCIYDTFEDPDIKILQYRYDMLKEIRTVKYDVLILDLIVPDRIGEEANNNDCIQEISTRNDINKPTCIIVLSQFDDHIKVQKETNSGLALAFIKYEQDSKDWENELRKKITFVNEIKISINQQQSQENEYDALIICALSEEFEGVKSAWSNVTWTQIKRDKYPYVIQTAKVPTSTGVISVMLACVNKAGVQGTSSICAALLSTYSIKHIFMTGICAAIKDNDVSLGDICIMRSALHHNTGKLKTQDNGSASLTPEIIHENASESLLNSLAQINLSTLADSVTRELKEKNLFSSRQNIRIHHSDNITTSFVVADNKYAQDFKLSSRKIDCVDMECYGLYGTAKQFNNKAICIKSVTDFADVEKGDNFHKQCCYSSAFLLYKLIVNHNLID